MRARLKTRVFIGGIAAGGCALLLGLGLHPRGFAADWSVPSFWLLAALGVLGELLPFRVPFRHESQDVTLSTTFVFAILLVFGLPAAVAVQALGSMLSDLAQRKVWWKAAFNIGQYTLAWTGCALTLATVSGRAHFDPAHGLAAADLPAILLAGLAFFLVNSTLIGIAIARTLGTSVLGYLRRDFVFQASTAAVLVTLTPVVVVVADAQLAFVPLLLIPIAAVHKSARISLAKEYQARHDVLTSLPNRSAFHDEIGQTIEEQPDRSFAVLIVDLDSFKEVNDTLGHRIGDRLLAEVAKRLADACADAITVARLGGDEFAVLAWTCPTGSAAAIGSQVTRALEQPLSLDGLTLSVGASIGAATYPTDGTDADTLVQRADVAMYLAKEQQSGFEDYDADRDRHTTRRLELLGELRSAITEGDLLLHYQPIADMTTERIRGVEALVRWQHRVHGLVGPDEFIPLAEPTGLIEPLTTAVLEQALHQCRVWHDAGHRVTISVNISVRNLHEDGFAAKVGRLLAQARLPAGALTLEITESSVMADPMRAAAVLGRLRAMGVGLALDDFGTGYSSLAYLKRLPVTMMKIDKSFVLNMDNDESDEAIVRSAIDLGRNLGLRVVAEGVETAAHWERLARLGCDDAQGYFLARPCPAGDVDLDARVRIEPDRPTDHLASSTT